MPLTPLLDQLVVQLDASEWFWLQVNETSERLPPTKALGD